MGFSRIVPLFSFGDNNQKKMFIVVYPKCACSPIAPSCKINSGSILTTTDILVEL